MVIEDITELPKNLELTSLHWSKNTKNFTLKFLKKNLKELLKEVVQNLSTLEKDSIKKVKNAHLQNLQKSVRDLDLENIIRKTDAKLKNHPTLINWSLNLKQNFQLSKKENCARSLKDTNLMLRRLNKKYNIDLLTKSTEKAMRMNFF